MNSKIIYIFTTVVIAFILLHNNILILLSNISSIMRKDNSCTLDYRMQEMKIESLERQLYEYESSMNNLKIYNPTTYVKAKIALRDIYKFYSYIVITTDESVKKNSAVVNEFGLVGFVKETDGTSARVSLLTSGDKISVKISNSYGVLDGYDKKDKTLVVHNINNYENINIGDIVYTSGLTDIEGNIEIGKVEKIETVGVEKIIYIKSSVDFDELNYLYVLNR